MRELIMKMFLLAIMRFMFSRTDLVFVCLFLGLFLIYTHVALVYFADCINYEIVFLFKLIEFHIIITW